VCFELKVCVPGDWSETNDKTLDSSAPMEQMLLCVPCEGTEMMRVGLSLTMTDIVSKPPKDAGEVMSSFNKKAAGKYAGDEDG